MNKRADSRMTPYLFNDRIDYMGIGRPQEENPISSAIDERGSRLVVDECTVGTLFDLPAEDARDRYQLAS